MCRSKLLAVLSLHLRALALQLDNARFEPHIRTVA
jgi:hypothetical protein